MKEISAKLIDNLQKLNIDKKTKIIVAVSGGVDSIVLLDLLAKEGFPLVVAHLNHGVRKEADGDEMFVSDLAKKYGLPFLSRKITPPKTGNLEEKLRDLRRSFLLEVAENHDAKYIALAHNMNDQAETFILNLTRGSGPNGLAAMASVNGIIIRPLLNVKRQEIEAYAKKNKLKWHEDATNLDLKYSRNYIRHKILPRLIELNPDVLENIFETTRVQREIAEHLQKEAKKYHTASTDVLKRLDDPLLFEVLLSKIEEVKGNRRNIFLKNLEEIKKLIQNSNGTKEISLPDNLTARRTYDKLDFLPKRVDNISLAPAELPLKMGSNRFGGWEILAEETKGAPQESKNKDFLIIDSTEFGGLIVRPKESGDKIAKNGINGSKKLQDIFTDAKIEMRERAIWPVVVNSMNEVIWVPYLAISRNVKITKDRNIKLTMKEVAKNEE